MARYFMKRVAMMAVAMFLIILLTFAIMHAVPGGPFTGEKKLSAEIEAAMNEKYHLNDPLPLQFVDYLKGVVRGDFGPSYKYPGKTVNEFIADGWDKIYPRGVKFKHRAINRRARVFDREIPVSARALNSKLRYFALDLDEAKACLQKRLGLGVELAYAKHRRSFARFSPR